MDISIPLYKYLSNKLGSEDVVLARRLLFALLDYFSSTKYLVRITSGSKGEGLDMEGSDLDIMILLNNIHIYESKPGEILSNSLVMDTETTQPGFTRLQPLGNINKILRSVCDIAENILYLSNFKIKLFYILGSTRYPRLITHGPCISPPNYEEDYAITLRCRSWISQANEWLTRNRLWPSQELISLITDFGVLFVPIGRKGSSNENLEWRVSFSMAEKILIHSFSHSQFLCYALLKLLLKEIIEKDEDCKGLLCSYFLKTVVFWVSENLPVCDWRPDNIVSCFMQVLKRLLYYVEYNHLPHYFIGDVNLFENRLSVEERKHLKDVLSELHQMGIFCMKNSKAVSNFFQTVEPIKTNTRSMEMIKVLIRKEQDDFLTQFLTPKTGPEKIMTLTKRFKLKKSNNFLYAVTWYDCCQILGSKQILRSTGNKDHYKNGYKQYFPYLLCGRKTDAVSGWLTIASYFYNMKRHDIVIKITDHVLTKCTPDKIYGTQNESHKLSDSGAEDLFINRTNVDEIYRRAVARLHRCCYISSINLPELKEICFYSALPPTIYAHFLKFLCLHHLFLRFDHPSDSQGRASALECLRETAIKRYFFKEKWFISRAYVCLCLAYSIIGDRDRAMVCKEEAKNVYFDENEIFFSRIMRMFQSDSS